MAHHGRSLILSVLLGLFGAAALLLFASSSRAVSAAPGPRAANAPNAGGITSTPATSLISPDGIGFGTAVATAGDVNADGYSDILVGNPQANSNSGSVRLYLGTSAGLNTTSALTLTGTGTERFGETVSPAGDVNGDGITDVIVGAPSFSSGTGRAYLYHGATNGLGASPALTLTGEASLDNFGAAIGPAGDVNGDGFSDIVIGANGFSSLAGRAYVYYGSPTGIGATPALTLTGLARIT